MKRQILINVLVLIFVSGFSLANQQPYKEGELVVRFSSGPLESKVRSAMLGPVSTCAVRSTISNFIVPGASVQEEYDRIVPGLSLVKLPGSITVEDALLQFNTSSSVLYAEPNYKLKLHQLIPNDPFFWRQWALHNIGQVESLVDADIDAPEAWEINPPVTTGDSSVVVAVADTGISSGIDFGGFHEDLLMNMWVNPDEDLPDIGVPDANDLDGLPDSPGDGYIDDIIGWDFAGDEMGNNTDMDNDPADFMGHGTHVAGIIGAIGNNGIGVSGVCWDVQMMALKISADDSDPEGTILVTDVYPALYYAINQGVKIINASWGGIGYSSSLYDVISATRDAGILFVASAGNDASTIVGYPAGYNLDNIITVMATDMFDQVAWYSNYGNWVDLAAPGGDMTYSDTGGIFSTFEGDYAYQQGTSMAAPHVSGAAALVWSYRPDLSYIGVKEIILGSVDKIFSLQGMCTAEGRLNLYNILHKIKPGRVRRASGGSFVGPVYSSIQQAINASNNGDEVITQTGFWYFEDINFGSKKIKVRSGNTYSYVSNGSDISPEDTCISGLLSDNTDPVVRIQNGQGSESGLEGFTIRDGQYGGISCSSTSPTITQCIIVENTATNGGGIYCNNSAALITDCTISNNNALASGGGFYAVNNSSADISNCEITNNTAVLDGGGIYCSDWSGQIADSTIADNTAAGSSYGNGGGGVYFDSSTGTTTDCEITNNSSGFSGGGILCKNSSGLEITNSTITENTTDLWGGGIYCLDSDSLIKNCLIVGNSVESWDGGGVYLENSSSEIRNCTIADNSASDRGGIGGGLCLYDFS